MVKKTQHGNRSVVNNLYAGTHNYKKVGDPATYFGNWERQTASTCDAPIQANAT